MFGMISLDRIPAYADPMTVQALADELNSPYHAQTGSYGVAGGDTNLAGIRIIIQRLRSKGKHERTLSFLEQLFDDYAVGGDLSIRTARRMTNEVTAHLRRRLQH